MRSDRELLGCARGADEPRGAREAAWSELVQRHTAKLYAVARTFDIDAATASDLVQTAWLRLLEHADRVRDQDAVSAWLAMVVRNEARKTVTRRRAVPVDRDFDRDPSPVAPEPDAALLTGERAHALRLGFARLGEECRRLLHLLVNDPPLSYTEIAAALDRPIGAIGPSRKRCLDQLRKALPVGFEP